MFKENRTIFKEGAPAERVESQSSEVDVAKEINNVEGIGNKKAEILAKIKSVIEQKDLNTSNKLDRLKAARKQLSLRYDIGLKIKPKCPESDRSKLDKALDDVLTILKEIDSEIKKLEQPAKLEVRAKARDDIKSLKREAPKPTTEKLPSEKQFVEFASRIQDTYTSRLESKDSKGFKKAEQACVNALAEDVMKATGCTDKGAIKVVIGSIPELTPDTILGIDEVRVGHPLVIDMGDNGVNKKLLFQQLWKHGLIEKEKATSLSANAEADKQKLTSSVDSNLEDKIPDKFLDTVKNKYSFPVDDPSDHEAVREKCVDTLVKDIVKATGCQDEDAIRRVLSTHDAYKPTITVNRSLIGSKYAEKASFEIDLSDNMNTDFKKRILFQYLADAGLIK